MWAFTVPSLRLCGRSRQPLLDACRQIKSILGDTGRSAGLFREGREVADITCPVNVGAATTVKDGNWDSPRFAPYVPFPDKQKLLPSIARNTASTARSPAPNFLTAGLILKGLHDVSFCFDGEQSRDGFGQAASGIRACAASVDTGDAGFPERWWEEDIR
jgi:hypothetical protein